ncbi:MAG: hypothetical protein OEY64_03065 [Nitrospinota bacterium]|nr:hypothetical protein [Nitrospinota bacterium]
MRHSRDSVGFGDPPSSWEPYYMDEELIDIAHCVTCARKGKQVKATNRSGLCADCLYGKKKPERKRCGKCRRPFMGMKSQDDCHLCTHARRHASARSAKKRFLANHAGAKG